MNALTSPKSILTLLGIAALAGSALAGTTQAAGSPPALARQSVDLEENAKNYTVTLAVPDVDAARVRVNLEGRTLRIASGQTASGARFEQSFQLPQADPTKNLDVARQKNRLVITVPKAEPGAAQSSAVAQAVPNASQTTPGVAQTPALPPPARVGAWESQVIGQFARMQRQMDALFDSAMQNFGQDDAFANFIGSGFGNAMPMAGKLSVQDKGNAYVVRAKDLNDHTKLDVNVDDGRLLRITTREENSANQGAASSYSSSSSTQIVTLPSAVDSARMTTKREGADVLITLPKA
jgi:HSP20 family molecular chaperone IbpA